MNRAIFIVSTGRTGTQSIARLVSRLEPGSFAAFHEPEPSRVFRLLSNMRMAGTLSDDMALRCLSGLRSQRLASFSGKNYLESNNFIFGFPDLLNRLYGASIVHIVRHPVDYAQSHLKHGAFRGLKGLAGRFFPYWLARPRFRGYQAPVWLAMSQYERLFWVWRLVNEYIEERCTGLDNQYRLLRFEEVFSDLEVFSGLMSYMGVAVESEARLREEMTVRANVGKGKHTELTIRDVESLNRICGPLAERYGYELPGG